MASAREHSLETADPISPLLRAWSRGVARHEGSADDAPAEAAVSRDVLPFPPPRMTSRATRSTATEREPFVPLVSLYEAVSPWLVLFARMLHVTGDAARAVRALRPSDDPPTKPAREFLQLLRDRVQRGEMCDAAAIVKELRAAGSDLLPIAERAAEVSSAVVERSESIAHVLRVIRAGSGAAQVREPRRAPWEVRLQIGLENNAADRARTQ